jgi:hypothetical protein
MMARDINLKRKAKENNNNNVTMPNTTKTTANIFYAK